MVTRFWDAAPGDGPLARAPRASQPPQGMTVANTTSLSTEDKVRAVAVWLDEKKAVDIAALDVRELSSITEALVLASATSTRHAQGLARHLMDKVNETGMEYLGMEGFKEGVWILVDLNDVLVHVFLDDAREFYDLEGLWSEGTPIELSSTTAS